MLEENYDMISLQGSTDVRYFNHSKSKKSRTRSLTDGQPTFMFGFS